MTTLKLWIAQGFGVGRIPWAPGTFGSLVGLLWFTLLTVSGDFRVMIAGAVAGLGLSVWLCGEGERILKQKDPGSIVLDEIAAIPVCFLCWELIAFRETGRPPSLDAFFSHGRWTMVVGVFAAFRFFDVVKPWPVRQSQALPGGWGITTDDFIAALYVNIVAAAVYGVNFALHGHLPK